MLPVVDRPVIQYVIEEAVDAGSMTSSSSPPATRRCSKTTSTAFPSSRVSWRRRASRPRPSRGRDRFSELAQIHFIRQGEALGLGHAIGMARNHVGDEPFVVLLGDDIMTPEAGVLQGMIDAYDEHGSLGRRPHGGAEEDISSYGCAAATEVSETTWSGSAAWSRSRIPRWPRRTLRSWGVTCSPRPSSRRSPRPGRGSAARSRSPTPWPACSIGRNARLHLHRGPLRHRQEVGLPACVVEMALARPDLGPEFRVLLGEIAAREGLVG